MSHKTSRKGGRSWWGKREAKAAGRVTRRRDERSLIEAYDETVEAARRRLARRIEDEVLWGTTEHPDV